MRQPTTDWKYVYINCVHCTHWKGGAKEHELKKNSVETKERKKERKVNCDTHVCIHMKWKQKQNNKKNEELEEGEKRKE